MRTIDDIRRELLRWRDDEDTLVSRYATMGLTRLSQGYSVDAERYLDLVDQRLKVLRELDRSER